MNKIQIHIFFNFWRKVIQVCLIISVLCKSCEPEIVFVLICILAEQFDGRKCYKTRESTLLYIGTMKKTSIRLIFI